MISVRLRLAVIKSRCRYRTVRSLVATKLLTSSLPLGDIDDDIPGCCKIRFNAKFKSKKKRMR